ncbi:MAG: DUF1552 domain-containing protein [Myxococcota bacterium]
MPKKGTLSRRLLLRGAGTVAIGLPFMPELLPREVKADEADGPCRVFTASFGLGIEESMQMEEFDGPLQPLQPFADKAAFFRNVDGGPVNASGTPHFSSSAALFTGVPQQPSSGQYHAAGPSMEVAAKAALHPNGVPNVSVSELSAGMWARTGADSQFTRQWNLDGSPGGRPERRPSRVFDTIFGGVETPTDPGEGPTPEELLERHVHRSVLDSVMDQYRSLVSDRSYLGAASKARIENHLAAIRDAENRLAPTEGTVLAADCTIPDAPNDPSGHGFYDRASSPTGAGAPAIDWEVARDTMRLIGEIMALGVVCDLLRFGSLIMVGGGGHIRFQGNYSALGSSLDFSNRFSGSTPHDAIFHQYDASAIRVYQHFAIGQLTHFLASLDAVTEANGQTALDNTLVLLGTEYGRNHSADNSFHAIVGGGSRFNAGWYDQALIPSDVYHQALAAFGIDSGIPSRWNDYTPTEITGLRNT